MIWLLRDFDLFSVILRAGVLAFEALTLGGIAFLLFAALPARMHADALRRLSRITGWMALALCVIELLCIAINAAILVGGSGFALRDVPSADFFTPGVTLAATALALFFLLRAGTRKMLYASLPLIFLEMAASVGMSHAASRLDQRPLLLTLTVMHHLGTAAWIGAMPYLLFALRHEEDQEKSLRYARRFSAMAVVSVLLLLIGGIGMAIRYTGSWQGMYGSTYGLMMLAKVYLFLVVLVMGAGNFFLLRKVKRDPAPLLIRLRRFSEAEIGLGFTAILAAASLTAQSPAADDVQDQMNRQQIVERIHWVTPRLKSPPFQALTPPSSLAVAVRDSNFSGGSISDATDRAWSEYNHHWAGVVVLAAGLLALLSRWRSFSWAKHWPLLFIGLAVFIVLRADPECWPLGPRPFWASLSAPDVLEHKLYAVLITAFAVFEWGVETGRVRSRAASYVFPLLCAIGGALLLTHSHGTSNVSDELLAEMSHTPIALLGASAGWGRWLELRLPEKSSSRVASFLWPVCLALVGVLLLAYRET